MHRDLRLTALSVQNDADNIEAARRRSVAGNATNVPASDRQNVAPLASVDCCRRRSKPFAGPGFDLNEAEDAIVPSDQINFTAVIRKTKICGNDCVAQAPQVQVSLEFAALSGQQVFRLARRQMAAGEIQTADDEFGQPHHEPSNTPDEFDSSGFRFPPL